MTNQRTTDHRTAVEAYRAAATEIEARTEALAEALDRHRTLHEAQPTDWGYVGDLGHVRELLNELIAFLPKKTTR